MGLSQREISMRPVLVVAVRFICLALAAFNACAQSGQFGTLPAARITPRPSSDAKLDVTIDGTGAGVVTDSGVVAKAKIYCGSSQHPQFSKCSTTLAKGSMINLQISPDTGSFVSSWSGACQGTGFFCNLTAKDPGQVFKVKVTLGGTPYYSSSVFKLSLVMGGFLTQYTAVSSAPEGISCGVGPGVHQCWLNFPAGTKALLAAKNVYTYGTDWKVEWTGCNPLGSGATCEVTMDQNRSVSVIFGK